jgi:hypothetical protein
MVNETPPEKWASGNGRAVASSRDYPNIAAAQTRTQRFRQLGVDFDSGEALHRGPQQIGCETVARSKLENVRPQVGAGEDPRHALLDGFSPSVRTAQPMVQAVHVFLS